MSEGMRTTEGGLRPWSAEWYDQQSRTLGESACRALGFYVIPPTLRLSVVIPVYNEEKTLRVLVDPYSKVLVLQVEDNGPGIPADQQEDIFKPFVSTKGSRGTGLGLPVSRKIVREHGGDIRIQSNPGQGTSVFVTLPIRGQRLT